MSKHTVTLVYDDTPPSLNTTGTRGSHWVAHRLKKRWQSRLEQLLMVSDLPRNLKRVDVACSLRFPTRRRRDEGNFRWCIEKACGDALVNGGWLSDDTPDEYRFGRVRFEDETGPHRVVLTLKATEHRRLPRAA